MPKDCEESTPAEEPTAWAAHPVAEEQCASNGTAPAFLTLEPLGPVQHEPRLHTPRWRATTMLEAEYVISLTDSGADEALAELVERATSPRAAQARA